MVKHLKQGISEALEKLKSISPITKCAVAGALAGVLNGFFGAGGGMLLVPLLIRWVKMEERKAFTSVFIILPLCVVSAAVFLFKLIST